ncbi:alpha/beta family hydrolase [Zhihengliuella sp.]|uniref:alpha/beta hydrolase family protein n=1 Tax=Zhihengliuella sp. TaxID=1954483 RepID=UPI002810E8AA|nr:alpha/beta family hydrolase [Zhihengliuella sp.]
MPPGSGEETRTTPSEGSPGRPTVVLAHGAGAGMEHPFMRGAAEGLARLGVRVLRFNFPYMDAGKKFPDRPPLAVGTWRSVMEFAADHADGPLWAAGKSFGGRMASMAVAEGMDAAGLIYLGYPLHAPGKPEKLRDEHLYGLEVPQLFLQGTRDTFARTDLLESVVGRLEERQPGRGRLVWIDGGDHSFAVKGTKREPNEVGADLAPAIADWLAAGAGV